MGKNKYRLGRDVFLPWDLLESKAFLELQGARAIRTLIRFYQKRTWVKKRRGRPEFFGTGLAFTYGEAAELGISASQFHTIIKRLYELGFIEIEYQGGGLARDYSRYAISERWRAYGTEKFEHREKPRTCRPGRDVNTLKKRKAQAGKAARKDTKGEGTGAGTEDKVTVHRKYQLRPTVTIEADA